MAGPALRHPHLVVLNCHMRGEHIQTRQDAKHVGSHMRLLRGAVDAHGGDLLREVFSQFWRELKAQPNWTLRSAGRFRNEVMVLAVDAHGRHRSEACLWLTMWNWRRLGGAVANPNAAKPYVRLCSQCWGDVCGHYRCPNRDGDGCDARMMDRVAEASQVLWRAAQLFNQVAEQELSLHEPPDLSRRG